MTSSESVRWLAAAVLGLFGAAVLWVFAQFAVGVACWFAFGKDEVPPLADFVANAAPWLIAIGGGIACGRMILASGSETSNSDRTER